MTGTEDTNTELIDGLMRSIGRYQLAMQVVYELAVYGPGNAGQIAERMTEHDDSGELPSVTAEMVDGALGELDQWSLLDFDGLEESDPIRLVSGS